MMLLNIKFLCRYFFHIYSHKHHSTEQSKTTNLSHIRASHHNANAACMHIYMQTHVRVHALTASPPSNPSSLGGSPFPFLDT